VYSTAGEVDYVAYACPDWERRVLRIKVRKDYAPRMTSLGVTHRSKRSITKETL